jgi:arylsulfatase A-like enzyme
LIGTRRQFLVASGAAGAALYLGDRRPSRPHAEGPNILLVVLDSLRADHAVGSLARTPTFDALARGGVVFPNCIPEAMPTVPARNSLLLGRRVFPFRDWHDHRGLIAKPGWEPLVELDSALTTVLWRAGWWTGYVTDNPFLGFSSPFEPFRRTFDLFLRHGGQLGGGDRPVDRALIDHWIHPAVQAAGMAERVRRYISNSDYSRDESNSFAARVFGSAAEALTVAGRRQPFFLGVDSFQPHEPWTPPREYVDLYGDPDYDGPEPAMPHYGRAEGWLDDDELPPVLERMRALYAAEVTMTDGWLGTLIERLHDLRLERDTIVVLVSDHGILLGERGWTGKVSSELHPELVSVPLLVADPRQRVGGTESAFPASTHDLAPTLLALLGVEGPAGMDGVELSPALRGEALPGRRHAYGGYSDSHFLRSKRWAYMADNRGERPRLFDLASDPEELHDVAGEHPGLVRDFYETVQAAAEGPLPSYG